MDITRPETQGQFTHGRNRGCCLASRTGGQARPAAMPLGHRGQEEGSRESLPKKIGPSLGGCLRSGSLPSSRKRAEQMRIYGETGEAQFSLTRASWLMACVDHTGDALRCLAASGVSSSALLQDSFPSHSSQPDTAAL